MVPQEGWSEMKCPNCDSTLNADPDRNPDPARIERWLCPECGLQVESAKWLTGRREDIPATRASAMAAAERGRPGMLDHDSLVAAVEEGNRRYWSDANEQIKAYDRWRISGFQGENPNHAIDGNIITYIVRSVEAAMARDERGGNTIEEFIFLYANAIARHGLDSEQTRKLRIIHAGNAEFIEYADTLDRVKRRLGGSSIDEASSSGSRQGKE
jgi:hypothetical protein